VVHVAADLAQFIQRREVLAYEQRLARSAYAYGVDLRRAAWLDGSMLGDPLMRAVDRRWNTLTASLAASELEDPGVAPPLPLMEEIARLVRLLRAPLPTLRLLRKGAESWSTVTPLGTTKGGIHWLVIDAPRLMAVPASERTFLLGSALGHLQCDHGPMFAAHLIGHRAGRTLGMVGALLRPWAKVAVFSADRAGLIALGDLEAALAAVRAHAEPTVSWWPRMSGVEQRLAALAEFDRSSVMARLRLMQARSSEASVGVKLQHDAPPQRGDGEADDEPRDDGDEADDVRDDPVPDDPDDVPAADADGDGRIDDAELAEALRGTWSLARCDQRLTRRLGLF
jgi:hypothetical protein